MPRVSKRGRLLRVQTLKDRLVPPRPSEEKQTREVPLVVHGPAFASPPAVQIVT